MGVRIGNGGPRFKVTAAEPAAHFLCIGSKFVNETVFWAKNRVFIGEINKNRGVNGRGAGSAGLMD
jgi:hypothetical protein